MEEDNTAYTAKQNALKLQLTLKATTTYQEPRQHQPNEKKGKVYSTTEEPGATSTAAPTKRPWNVWDRTLEGKPLTYDETKFCTYHKAKANESNQAVHPNDQDAAAPLWHRDDTNTKDERPQSSSSEDNNDRDLRDHLQQKRSTTDLQDTLIQSKKTKLSDDDLPWKLTPKVNTAAPDLWKSLSDKRPSVFRRVNVILGGSPLCNNSVKAIKENQRKAPHNIPLPVELQIDTFEVTRVLIDTGRSVDLIFRQTLIKMMVDLKDIKPLSRTLTGFNGSSTQLLGTIRLNVFIGGVSKLVKFSVIDTKIQYNAILGTPWLHMMKEVSSTYHQCVKFPTREETIFTLKGNQCLARSMLISDFKNQQIAFLVEPEKKLSPQKEETIQVSIDTENPYRTVGIGSKIRDDLITELTIFLRANKLTFAWMTADMPGIDPTVTAHRLNVDLTYKPVKQK
ncbi:hypothetical protein N665_0143s0004 [Sinapis alba]|nr:hypothetical protein N665_0143s0004 [Sinapis alba]